MGGGLQGLAAAESVRVRLLGLLGGSVEAMRRGGGK